MTSTHAVRPEHEGRLAAIAGYGFYLLSIPSLAVFAPIGAVIAWTARDSASPFVRTHLDEQLRLFGIAVLWGVGLFLLSIPAWILTIVLIGIPMLFLIGLTGFLVMVWFTVRSIMGLVRLLEERDA